MTLRVGLLAALLLASAGCRKAPPEAAATWELVPRLPSPSAGTYARAPAPPTDPPLEALLHGHTWDASISGAAAAVALQITKGEATPTWRVRHHLWRAGYPYPVHSLNLWRSPIGEPPPPEVEAWVTAQTEGSDLGLVRARASDQDVWVGMVATPRASIGVQPRQLPLDASFTLPVVQGATFQVADPTGRVQDGSLDLAQTFTVDVPGEWLIKVSDGQGVVARFPLYAGTTPPADPVLDLPLPDGPPEVQAESLIDQLREARGLASLEPDLLLQSAARKLLVEPGLSGEALATRLGIDADRLARWDVRDATVIGALDQAIWEPGSRPALLAASGQIGVAAAEEGGRVHLVVLVGFDEAGPTR